MGIFPMKSHGRDARAALFLSGILRSLADGYCTARECDIEWPA